MASKISRRKQQMTWWFFFLKRRYLPEINKDNHRFFYSSEQFLSNLSHANELSRTDRVGCLALPYETNPRYSQSLITNKLIFPTSCSSCMTSKDILFWIGLGHYYHQGILMHDVYSMNRLENRWSELDTRVTWMFVVTFAFVDLYLCHSLVFFVQIPRLTDSTQRRKHPN